ncbi:MAG: hypothetical protein EOP46_01195 [Sphingobacteriaceae bacterium]|nr:MAG: hypothetical protein EOP46_01195 [Sphingobacteriaceae bacterium]
MKTLALALFMGCFISSCTHTLPNKAHTREVFDARGLKVITSFANRKQQTISVLYGNQLAMQSAATGLHKHVAGEVFKLVTFNRANNKYWYGSYINGSVKSVETLSTRRALTGDSSLINYVVERGKAPLNATGKTASEQQRINSILLHKPLVFPQ